MRNLRFFKDASKQHINDFNRSPVGFKFRSSSDPNIHQQLSEEQEEQLIRGTGSTTDAPGDDTTGEEKEEQLQQQQQQPGSSIAEERRRQRKEDRETRKSRNRTLLPDFQCTTATTASSSSSTMSDHHSAGSTSNGVGDKTTDDKEPDNDKARAEGGGVSDNKQPAAKHHTERNDGEEGAKSSTSHHGTSEKSGRVAPDVVVRIDAEPSENRDRALAKNMAAQAADEALLAVAVATGSDPTTKTRRKSVGERADGPGGSSSGGQDLTGTAVLYRVLSDGAAQLSNTSSSGGGATGGKSEAAAPSKEAVPSGDKKASTDSTDRKKGGLIARYKNLVSTMEKEREKNPDALKSLTEGAVARKKKKEKEREEREKGEEGKEEWEKGESESSKRKKRSGSARKERAKRDETQQPPKKDGEQQQQKKKQSNTKKLKKSKKSTKESSDSGATAGKKEKRSSKKVVSRPGSMVGGASLLTSTIKRQADSATAEEPTSGRRRPQEVDERVREHLRKLSMAPPPKIGEPGVSAIRRRMMSGDPFTVVICEEVSWSAAGRGGQAKPSRSLGSKSSRIDTGDSLIRRPSSDLAPASGDSTTKSTLAGPFGGAAATTKRSVNTGAGQRHSAHASTTGNESGSGKEERKASAPITLKAKSATTESSPPPTKATTDILLFGADGELVIEESDEGEDWDKDLAKDTKKKHSSNDASGGNHIKLVGPGEGLVVEGSDDDEDWDKELQLASDKKGGLKEAEEEDEEDWDREFGGNSPETTVSKMMSESVKEAKAKAVVEESDEDEDWDKELAAEEETKKQGDERPEKAKAAVTSNAKTKAKTKAKESDAESEDEDWDKELAAEDEGKEKGNKPQEASKLLLASTENEEDEDWDKEFAAAAETPKVVTTAGSTKGGAAKENKKAAEESEDEDWGKEFDQEEEQQQQGAKKDGDAGLKLNLGSLDRWEEDKDDWGDGFETEEEPTTLTLKVGGGVGEESNDSKSERTDGDEDEDWAKAFGEASGGAGTTKARASSDGASKKRSAGPKATRKGKEKEKEKGKEKEKEKGSKREKRKRTKSSAAARRIEIQNRAPSPPHSTSTPSTPRSHTSSRVSSFRDLAEEEADRKRDCASPPTGRFSVVKVQYLHSRSPKWIERERNARAAAQLVGGGLGNDADKAMAATGAANTSIMASLSSFLSPRVVRGTSKEKSDSGATRLGQGSRSNRDLSSPPSKDGSLSSTASTAGPYVPFHPPSFETVGWDPVLQQWSKRLCGAHYAEDITVTMRLLGEDLILVYDQIFKFDDRGVLYSWNAGGNRGVRETNFFDVYTALVEKEGETCEEVGYLADL